MLELLFLLLPIAAMYGYYMGSHKVKEDKEKNAVKEINTFIKGINYFLYRDKDKAVDELITFYDSKTKHSFEEIITLGTLFREKGDIEKAIGIHNQLAQDASLTPEQRNIALLELSKDFIKVGLFSNAEEILKELLGYQTHKLEVVKLLIQIYQSEKEWQQAINIIDSFGALLGTKYIKEQAQYYCELGHEAFACKSFDVSSQHFKKALSINPSCGRAIINLVKINLEQGNTAKALTYLLDLENVDTELLPLGVKLLDRCYTEKQSEEKLKVLEGWLNKSKAANVILEISNIISKRDGIVAAEEFLLRFVKTNPTPELFDKLLSYTLTDASVISKDNVLVIQGLIQAYLTQKHKYICHKCGFKSSILFWQCPHCHKWESMKPNTNINNE